MSDILKMSTNKDSESIDELRSSLIKLVNDVESRIETNLRTMSNNLSKSKTDKMWDVATKIAVPVIIASLGFLWNLNQRVVIIESTRISSSDFQKEINAFNLKLNTVMGDLQKGPDWLRDGFVKLNASIDSLKDQTAKLSERVVRLEVKLEDVKK